MTLHATPNLNGNPASDFMAASNALSDAMDVLRGVMRTISADVLHGRNYQTVTQPLARQSDCQRHIELQESFEALDSYAYDIGKMGTDHG